MKKILLLSGAILLGLASSVLAYSQTDLDNANYFASIGVISYQENPKKYRLDTKISRYEAVLMALRLKGVDLTAPYVCQGYFRDANENNMKCRVMELAADNDLIARTKYAMPNSAVRYMEALRVISVAQCILPRSMTEDEEPYNSYYSQFAKTLGKSAKGWELEVLAGFFSFAGSPDGYVNTLPFIHRTILRREMLALIQDSRNTLKTSQICAIDIERVKKGG